MLSHINLLSIKKTCANYTNCKQNRKDTHKQPGNNITGWQMIKVDWICDDTIQYYPSIFHRSKSQRNQSTFYFQFINMMLFTFLKKTVDTARTTYTYDTDFWAENRRCKGTLNLLSYGKYAAAASDSKLPQSPTCHIQLHSLRSHHCWHIHIYFHNRLQCLRLCLGWPVYFQLEFPSSRMVEEVRYYSYSLHLWAKALSSVG